MATINQVIPKWRELRIHKSSPVQRGSSIKLARECPGYLATHYFPDIPLGSAHAGFRCEDLERQTFEDESFHLVITQDVFEHLFRPDLAQQEIWRTLKPGGFHVHTVPIYRSLIQTVQRAERLSDGSIRHLKEPPEYHGNPINSSGSLVTYHYGYDYADLVASWAPFDVEIRRFNNRTSGIVAAFTEVTICQKRG